MKRFALALLLAILPVMALAADYPARVVGVTDGDTLTVLTAEKRQVKIRLEGIDAPEISQPFGGRAKQVASELAFGKDVTVLELNQDRYGRTVAEVILPSGRSMSLSMIDLGMAWWFKEYAPNDLALMRSQVCSKRARIGLWSGPNPVPPWDWRKGKGVPVTAEVVGIGGAMSITPLTAGVRGR